MTGSSRRTLHQATKSPPERASLRAPLRAAGQAVIAAQRGLRRKHAGPCDVRYVGEWVVLIGVRVESTLTCSPSRNGAIRTPWSCSRIPSS